MEVSNPAPAVFRIDQYSDLGRDMMEVLFRHKMNFSNTVHIFLAGTLGKLLLAPAIALAQAPAPATFVPGPPSIAAPSLTAAQIVSQMEGHNLARAAALKHFHSVRHYSVEYRGYSAKVAAQM